MSQRWFTHPLILATSLIAVVIIMAVAKTDWSLGKVSGRITLNGKPLRGITLVMQPEEGRPSQGTTNADGYYIMRYTLQKDGVRVGKANVYLESFRYGIPHRYFKPFQELDIHWGSNRFDLEMTSENQLAFRRDHNQNNNRRNPREIVDSIQN